MSSARYNLAVLQVDFYIPIIEAALSYLVFLFCLLSLLLFFFLCMPFSPFHFSLSPSDNLLHHHHHRNSIVVVLYCHSARESWGMRSFVSRLLNWTWVNEKDVKERKVPEKMITFHRVGFDIPFIYVYIDIYMYICMYIHIRRYISASVGKLCLDAVSLNKLNFLVTASFNRDLPSGQGNKKNSSI